MGRPKRVIFEKFGEYDKLHTKKTIYRGIENTTLYPIKETKDYFLSIEVWAFCASKFRMKKKNIELSVDIPIVTDEKAVAFLNEHCWADWVAKETKDKGSDVIEAVALLDKIFPTHEKVYFYEFNSLIASYLHEKFISLDDNGNVKPQSENSIKTIKYYLQKYGRGHASNEVKERQLRWTECKGSEKEKEKLLTEYIEFERDWVYKNANITDTLIEVCKNSVCYPVAFSDGTGMWAIEKYGKPMEYSNAGEIFFVVTKDKVFFEITRHF